MGSAAENFVKLIQEPDSDPTVASQRTNLTRLKLDALEQVQSLDDEGWRQIMPNLYEQIVVAEIHIAGQVGLGTSLALSLYDEHLHGSSLSRFSREVREQMTGMGVALKRRHSSRLAKLVAEVEAQRLALRHGHEFLSWLAFRRGDERYPPVDRLERMEAFKLQTRLLQSRDVLVRLLGPDLAAALESTDRFLLANRWRLAATAEHAVERYVWPLLSFQASPTVRLERARWEYDALVEQGAPPHKLEEHKLELGGLLREQLEYALQSVPETALAGSF